MFLLDCILLVLSIYFAKEAYDNYKVELAMFWSMLVGWNVHTLLGIL
jgi:hypothetical protein